MASKLKVVLVGALTAFLVSFAGIGAAHASMQTDVVSAVNQQRSSGLTWDSTLAAAAQAQADRMTSATHSGYSRSGWVTAENVAWAPGSDAWAVVSAWAGSSGHAANMRGTQYSHAGAGYSPNGGWVLIVGAPVPVAPAPAPPPVPANPAPVAPPAQNTDDDVVQEPPPSGSAPAPAAPAPTRPGPSAGVKPGNGAGPGATGSSKPGVGAPVGPGAGSSSKPGSASKPDGASSGKSSTSSGKPSSKPSADSTKEGEDRNDGSAANSTSGDNGPGDSASLGTSTGDDTRTLLTERGTHADRTTRAASSTPASGAAVLVPIALASLLIGLIVFAGRKVLGTRGIQL